MPDHRRAAPFRRTIVAWAVAALLAGSAMAAEPKPRSPLDYTVGEYGLALGTALFGGAVAWFTRVRRGDASGWDLRVMLGELCTSAFAGLLCFWACELAGAPQLMTAVLVGISGHMGTRAITVLEHWAAARFMKHAPAEVQTALLTRPMDQRPTQPVDQGGKP